LPQAPQFWLSVWILTQVPPQFVSPAWQLSPHVPPEQTLPAGHTFPQAPQFALSVSIFAQVPPQFVWPAPHVVWQVPPEQTIPAAQV
jgi:hypothetical protein